MTDRLPGPLRDLADLQRGVLTRRQALAAGLTDDLIESWAKRGRWQRLHHGVYATFTGSPDRQATLWAAVLLGGRGAALSYQSAAELDGLLDRPAPLVHVTVPISRRVAPPPGIVVHSRRNAESAVHPARLPPRTRIEETVLDLTNMSQDLDDAIAWVTSALGRRLTTQQRLSEAAASRSRLRWRSDIGLALSSDLAGVHSILEFRYARDVENAHGLPRGSRQVRAGQSGRSIYRDVLYEQFGLVVELDGKAAHSDQARWLDVLRDNCAAATGLVTLRYGYWDVRSRPCPVAAQVATTLQARGWQGHPRPCSPGCPLRAAIA